MNVSFVVGLLLSLERSGFLHVLDHSLSILAYLVPILCSHSYRIKQRRYKPNRCRAILEVLARIIQVNTRSRVEPEHRECGTHSLDPTSPSCHTWEDFL